MTDCMADFSHFQSALPCSAVMFAAMIFATPSSKLENLDLHRALTTCLMHQCSTKEPQSIHQLTLAKFRWHILVGFGLVNY